MPTPDALVGLHRRIADAIRDESLASSFVERLQRSALEWSSVLQVRQLTAVEGASIILETFESRSALLAKLRAGEDVRIQFDAITFRQGAGPNRNFTRLRKGALRSTAKSGKGTPFLANHDWNDVRARGGTVLKSVAQSEGQLAGTQTPGEMLFVQTIECVKPWAVEGVLDGTIDRFSIGWVATGPILCTLCNAEAFTECFHLPGEEVQLGDDGAETAIVEWEFTSADLVEVSAVNVPAVVGTGIKEVRAALAAHHHRPTRPQPKGNRMDNEKLAKLLGLPSTASEAEIHAAIEKSRADSARLGETEKRLAALEVDAARREQEARQLKIEKRIDDLRREGKLVANSDGIETSLRRMAEVSFETFETYCDTMPVIVPQGVQTPAADPHPPNATAQRFANAHLPSVLRSLGLTENDVDTFGPKPGQTMFGRLPRESYTGGGD